jgi:2',3'-cyclic-nucleotide 2'-phosphodiesterase (5'-nucleotidase family)
MRAALARHVSGLGRIQAKDVEMGRLEDRYLTEAIGETKVKLGDDILESYPSIYDLIAQAMIEPPLAGDLSLVGARDAHWSIKAGKPITQRDLIEITPWNNALVAVSITGAQIATLMRRFVEHARKTGEFPAYFAGARLEVGAEHEGGFKLTIGRDEVDPERMYRLITPSYLLTGPPGFEAFGELGLTGEPQEGLMRDVVARFVKAQSPIDADTFPSAPRLVHPTTEARPRRGEAED